MSLLSNLIISMEAEKQGHNSCGECGYGCGMGCMSQRHWMHVIIKILVALFIFWCGVQFGELKALLHQAGYGMMGGYGHNQMYYSPDNFGGYGMMGGYPDTQDSTY